MAPEFVINGLKATIEGKEILRGSARHHGAERNREEYVGIRSDGPP